MESKAKILGHALHPILIVFPLGLLSTGVIFDAIHLIWSKPPFLEVAYWMIAAGIIGGLAAALPGWIDWFAIPSGTRAKSVGLLHGIGNVFVLLLFTGSWYLRHKYVAAEPSVIGYALSFAGFALAGITGWLGGELVDRLGVGVDDGAHLDAPSSLSNQPASQNASKTSKTFIKN